MSRCTAGWRLYRLSLFRAVDFVSGVYVVMTTIVATWELSAAVDSLRPSVGRLLVSVPQPAANYSI